MDLTSVGRVTLMMNVMPFLVAIGSHFSARRTHVCSCVYRHVQASAVSACILVFSDYVNRPGPYAFYGDSSWRFFSVCCEGSHHALRYQAHEALPRRPHPAEKTLLYQLAGRQP